MEEKKHNTLFFSGSIVLGLNDALIEITGVLAGLTLAFQDVRTVLIAGTLTGFAAALSMASSGYLESKQEVANGKHRHPHKDALYTGGAYFGATILLLLPYTYFSNVFSALGATIITALAIIAAFVFYVTSQRKTSFWKQFGEMAALSMGVATVSFGLAYLLRLMGV